MHTCEFVFRDHHNNTNLLQLYIVHYITNK